MEIYPVVHINDTYVAREQVTLALDFGADGVYLIDHNGRTDTILETLRLIRSERPDSFIGINLLGHRIDEVYDLIERIANDGDETLLPSAVWADNVENNAFDPTEFLERKNRNALLGKVKLLGGISFKYTSTFSENPEIAGAEVARLRDSVDVVTTSGAGTGKPPTVEKLKAVRQAACGKPVAVASGVSAGNIYDYAGLVDQILVSTSIETYPYSGVFDSQKLEELIRIAHGI